eukprot:TRINITY_DN91050_c0_g1_i1.p1 TRINITY_DN91050_c0_g1~~TRINITY_DN91050_c0_g1_i1.p1  ORF type:complete len:1072 (-),score=296.13 TRINITY_DN91050_c0_g1_i1:111-3326(-)
MGEARLKADVQVLRQRLEDYNAGNPPEPLRLQRVALVDNIVEFKVLGPGSGKRLNFLIYEADVYPDCGGVMMSEDESEEALVDAINARLGEPESITVAEALVAACEELKLQDDAALMNILRQASRDGADRAAASGKNEWRSTKDDDVDMSSPPPTTQDMEGVETDDAGFAFDEDDDGVDADYSAAMYLEPVVDRERRPGWKKMKWQEVEEQRLQRRREQYRRGDGDAGSGNKRRKGAGTGEMTAEEQKAADEQMWSSQEAFTILCNELYQLQTEAEEHSGRPDLEVDCVDYDVHQWTVKLRNCAGELGAGLRELNTRFGYDYIELLISFKEDLYPFYPPTCSVVRPRLWGKYDIPVALACHPRLQLRGWSPFQRTKDVLLSIRSFFERIARVDVHSVQNDITKFPTGAFLPLERSLAQLGALCDIVPMDLRQEQPQNPYKDDPWAQDAALSGSSLGAMLARKRANMQAAQQPKGGWAAGTGFGHDEEYMLAASGPFGAFPGNPIGKPGAKLRLDADRGGGAWDPKAMKAAQVAQDEELELLLSAISDNLRGISGYGSRNSNCCLGAPTGSELELLLCKSCLPPFLERELCTSFTNMGDRLSLFQQVLTLVEDIVVCLQPQQAKRVLEQARPHLRCAQDSAKLFLDKLRGTSESSEEVKFAKRLLEVADLVQRRLQGVDFMDGATAPAPQAGVQSAEARQAEPEAPLQMQVGGSSSSTAPADFGDDDEKVYCRRMKAFQFEQCDFATRHSFAQHAAAEVAGAPQARTLRLAKEMAGLLHMLPLCASSSVFVRVDEARQQLWRVLITGPDDTPYSGGCFIFDVYFPEDYPNHPPKVHLLTTGGNSVSFNPNLYETGKVCLSLLGTWRGDISESWNPTTSRVLQVLVSIQSLILVPEPYFNEPGFERDIGTDVGRRRSTLYNEKVRRNCLQWAMLDQLANPKEEFRDTIREHFHLRGVRIEAMLQTWITEGRASQSVGSSAAAAETGLPALWADRVYHDLEANSRRFAKQLERLRNGEALEEAPTGHDAAVPPPPQQDWEWPEDMAEEFEAPPEETPTAPVEAPEEVGNAPPPG